MSFYKRVKKRFFAKPHVGVVKHFEGSTLREIQEAFTEILSSKNVFYEFAIEDTNGKHILNYVARLDHGLHLWMYAEELPDVGCIVEMKVFHALEESAAADEHLTRFVEMLDKKIRNKT